VPAYPLTGEVADVVVQRVILRQGVSRDLVTVLISDIKAAIAHLLKHRPSVPLTPSEAASFNHL
jgi:glutamate decarboxylase